MMLFFGFFFSSRRRHTRLVSDWSSDVCSSDLKCFVFFTHNKPFSPNEKYKAFRLEWSDNLAEIFPVKKLRSEERRVGKECRSRWSRNHEKKKTIDKGQRAVKER